MKDISIFKNVVVFDAEGLRYQAIWKDNYWVMAAFDQARVLEMHDVHAPHEATPGVLLKAWWNEQKKVGTYSVPTTY